MSALGVITLAALALGLSNAFAANASHIEVGQSAENQERLVDETALQSQEKAISTLKVLLGRYRGHRQEPTLLFKLADVQAQAATIRFRVAHGTNGRTGKGLDLSAYRKNMREMIATLDELIKKYPDSSDIPRSYFMRGKAYEEIDDKAHASQDYLYVVGHFPSAEEIIPAYMALAQFAIDANEHAKAIPYLMEVEKYPNHPQYPFALYKLAWAHFNLKEIPIALSYAEKQVAHYNAKRNSDRPQDSPSTSDQAFRENMLLDSTLFFSEGLEQGLAAYKVKEALPYFRKLESGPLLGKMLERFAKLLRTHGHELELITWKSTVLAEESKRPESLSVLMITFENQVNRRRYTQFSDTTHDFIELFKSHPDYTGWPNAQKLILDTAAELQATVVKNKKATGVKELSTVLASLYESFIQLVKESDPRIPKVYYNLAEAEFEIEDYAQATHHYRWIVDHGQWNRKKTEPGSVVDASLKAIAARYELLQKMKLVPGELKAKSLADGRDAQGTKIDGALLEWIVWIEDHISKSGAPIENFYFEASRCLYAQDLIAMSIGRLEKFAFQYPNSKYAIPSATLVLDTYIATARWDKLHEVARQFLKVDAWKNLPFQARLTAVAADAFYKTAEEKFSKQDYSATLDLAETFFKRYGQSARLADALLMAGNAAFETKDYPRSTAYYTRLIEEAPHSELIPKALGRRAQMAEMNDDFTSAAHDYLAYLKLKSEAPLREKTLALAALSGDAATLRMALDSPTVCSDQSNDHLASVCDRYRGLLRIEAHDFSEASTHDAVDHMKNGVEANRSLWAAVALEDQDHLGFHERLSAIRQIGNHWEDLDSNDRLALVPLIAKSIPLALSLDRKKLTELAPLRANVRYITARVDLIKEIESAATKAMKLPWSRVRSTALSEVAALYLDLSHGLQSIPAPKNLSESDLTTYNNTVSQLVIPFEEKGQDMRAKAFEIASRFSIEDEAYQSVATPYFADNASTAQKLKPTDTLSPPSHLDLNWLDQFDRDHSWSKMVRDTDDSDRILHRWALALKAQNWIQAAYFLQQAKDHSVVNDRVHSFMKAVALNQMGARGEGLAEIEDVQKSAPEAERRKLLLTLLAFRRASLSREKTSEILSQWKDLGTPEPAAPQQDRSVAAAPSKAHDSGEPAIEAARAWAYPARVSK